MLLSPAFLLTFIGVILVGIVLIWAIRDRNPTILLPAQSERLNEIFDAVGQAGALKNIDPWGEVTITHLAKLKKQFDKFCQDADRATSDPHRLRLAGARLYLDCMEILQGVGRLLHKLALADPAYYRDILQNESGVAPDEYAAALRELATIQGLEEEIQSALFKTEKALVALDEALRLLELRQDPSGTLESAIQWVRSPVTNSI